MAYRGETDRRDRRPQLITPVSQPVTILSPELPPTIGGLADYTAHLIANWPGAQEFDVMIPRRETFRANLPTQNGTVLLQYSAYGFDRYGYPRWLLDALLDWKRKSDGRLCVMFHEIWTFWPWWNKNFVIQMFHRRAITRLLRAADAVFTTTASQADYLSRLAPGCNVRVLPVGANVVPTAAPPTSRERGMAVLFGMQGTRVRALRETAGDWRALVPSGRIERIVAVGGGTLNALDAEEKALLEALQLRSGFRQLGAKNAREVSAILASAEFGIAAQDPLSYTKSGTFMAYAAHGLNILSKHAAPAAKEPTCLLTSPAELSVGLADVELHRRGQKLRAWYERTASWPQIAQEFARAVRSQR